MNELLSRINNYMKVKGLKQVDIANKSGLSIGYISKVLNGKKSISYNFLNALSDLTGESLDFWLNGTDEKCENNTLSLLIDAFIADGTIKPDGSYDEKTLNVFISLINKEISDKLKCKEQK